MTELLTKRRSSGVEIPEGLANRIKRFVKGGQYRTVTEFVLEAIRKRLEELER